MIHLPYLVLPENKKSRARRFASGAFCRSGVCMFPEDARLSVADAALHFGLSKAHINKWYADGHLADVTKDENGHRLYLLSELVEAEHRTRHHPNSRRKPQLVEAF